MKDNIKTPSVNYSTSNKHRRLIKKQLHEHGSFTTIYARDVLDIPSPAPRIFELRHYEGLNIQSIWTTDTTVQGVKHRFVRYVLKPGTYGEVQDHA